MQAGAGSAPRSRRSTDQTVVLPTPRADVVITRLGSGRNRIDVKPRDPKLAMTFDHWETGYPLELIERILEAKGPGYVCDEIARDESPEHTGAALRIALLSYVDEAELEDARVLDFGCGAGATTVTLGRTFPSAEIVGVDVHADALAIAGARASFYGLEKVSFHRTPSAAVLPAELGSFDHILMCGVYEHLLPAERATLLPSLWSALRPGGVLFLRGTPHRFFPVETHTTRLPLINYLPDAVVRACVSRISRRFRGKDWPTLLRDGIRGGTVSGIVRQIGAADVEVLEPAHLGVTNRIDLWYVTTRRSRHSTAKAAIRSAAKAMKRFTGVEIAPYLDLALRKKRRRA